MKNLRYFLLAFTALSMTTSAYAQQTNVKASVPFDFVVGNQAYAAGEYSIKTEGVGDRVLRIDNTADASSAMVLSDTCVKLEPSDKTKLVFHRVGDSYFLYQVWRAGNSEGREFPISRSELLLTYNHPGTEETIIIAANISN